MSGQRTRPGKPTERMFLDLQQEQCLWTDIDGECFVEETIPGCGSDTSSVPRSSTSPGAQSKRGPSLLGLIRTSNSLGFVLKTTGQGVALGSPPSSSMLNCSTSPRNVAITAASELRQGQAAVSGSVHMMLAPGRLVLRIDCQQALSTSKIGLQVHRTRSRYTRNVVLIECWFIFWCQHSLHSLDAVD